MKMENEIRKLISKYADKTTEEPLQYLQWIECVEDLQSLLKLYQAQSAVKKIPTIHDTVYMIGEK